MSEPARGVEERLDHVEGRLGTLDRRVSSMDQRLERVETRLEAFQAGTNTFHTAILAEMSLMNQRGEALEKLLRDRVNGDGA